MSWEEIFCRCTTKCMSGEMRLHHLQRSNTSIPGGQNDHKLVGHKINKKHIESEEPPQLSQRFIRKNHQRVTAFLTVVIFDNNHLLFVRGQTIQQTVPKKESINRKGFCGRQKQHLLCYSLCKIQSLCNLFFPFSHCLYHSISDHCINLTTLHLYFQLHGHPIKTQ